MSDFNTLIAAEERALEALVAQRAAFVKEQEALLAAIGETDSLAEDAQARFDALSGEKRTADANISERTAKVARLKAELEADQRATADAEKRTPTGGTAPAAKVVREERTYTKGNAHERSFFADMYSAQFGLDSGARERVERHMQEARVEGEISKRAVGTSAFAGLVPPVYLTDEYALIARAGRPTANIVRHEDLPDQGMSIIIPRGTTGAATAIQATENSAVQNTDEVWANLTVPVVTIAGQQDVSRQSLERGVGIDSIVYADLAAAYAVNLDQQVLSGSGSAGQILGILNTGSINQATAFTAAATVATFYTKLAGQLNAVETSRYLAPNVIIMHPRRWNWLVAQLDSSNRPLLVPNANGPFNAYGVSQAPIDTPSVEPVGWILGVPVITDASVPTSVGSGPEDQVIVARKEDLILWEDSSAPFQLKFEQTTGGSLTTKLVAYGYAAFTAGRYPAAVGVVGGNSGAGFGLVAPTF